MFSYDDRMKAVLLYIQYDRGSAATVRDLGYPTTKTLKSWYREYIATGDLHGGRICKSGFTEEKERVAVDYYLEHGRRISVKVRFALPNWSKSMKTRHLPSSMASQLESIEVFPSSTDMNGNPVSSNARLIAPPGSPKPRDLG